MYTSSEIANLPNLDLKKHKKYLCDKLERLSSTTLIFYLKKKYQQTKT